MITVSSQSVKSLFFSDYISTETAQLLSRTINIFREVLSASPTTLGNQDPVSRDCFTVARSRLGSRIPPSELQSPAGQQDGEYFPAGDQPCPTID
jgi:hypothetical protein